MPARSCPRVFGLFRGNPLPAYPYDCAKLAENVSGKNRAISGNLSRQKKNYETDFPRPHPPLNLRSHEIRIRVMFCDPSSYFLPLASNHFSRTPAPLTNLGEHLQNRVPIFVGPWLRHINQRFVLCKTTV